MTDSIQPEATQTVRQHLSPALIVFPVFPLLGLIAAGVVISTYGSVSTVLLRPP